MGNYPPGPTDPETIMSVAMAFRDPSRLTSALMKVADYGKIASIELPRLGRVNVVTDPEAVEMIYRNQVVYPKNQGLMALMQGKTLGRNNVVFSTKPNWDLQRPRMNRFTHPNAVKRQIPALIEIIDQVFDQVDNQDGVITMEDWSGLTFAMGTQIFFSRTLGEDQEWLASAISFLFAEESELAPFKMTPDFATVYADRLEEYARVKTDVDAFIQDEVATRRKSSDRYNDLIDSLIDMMDDPSVQELVDQGVLDSSLLEDNVRTAFVASTETTASSLGFLFWELFLDSEFEDKVAGELRELGAPGHETWKNAPYLRMGAEENWRKNTIAPTGLRVATPGASLLGFDMEGMVIVPVGGIHHMEEYHPYPYLFLPEERFGENPVYPVMDWTYLPFGAGPRICLGKPLAEVEVALTASIAYQRYERIIVLPPYHEEVVTTQVTTTQPPADCLWQVIY